MTERCLCDDYKIRGRSYELWTDSSNNWWLSADHHKPGWALTGDDFDPPLTNDEITSIGNYIDDWFIND